MTQLNLNLKLNLQKQALKNRAQSYKVNIMHKSYSLHQLNESKPAVEKLFRNLLQEMKGFKYCMSLGFEFMKKIYIEETYSVVCFNSPTKIVTNDGDVDLNKDDLYYWIKLLDA